MRDFKAPEYQVDGVLQRGFLNALTGHPGQGKTAIALCLAMHVIRGEPLADREVTQGRVLYFAGENPDDIRMRWHLLAAEYGFDPKHENMIWCTETGDLTSDLEAIFKKADDLGDVVLIVIDTSSAYFPGNDENNNTEARAHWASMRRFTNEVANRPCVLVLCHPAKNATDLTPRGGSAALGEMDCNITCELENDIAEIAPHSKKFRGVRFAPLSFKMVVDTCAALKLANGKRLYTVYAEALGEDEADKLRDNKRKMLQRAEELHLSGALSLRAIAGQLKKEFKNEAPSKSALSRHFKKLGQSQSAHARRH